MRTKFSSMCLEGVRITTLLWINLHQNPLLLVGSADGVIRIWKTMDNNTNKVLPQPTLISGFTALPYLAYRSNYIGLTAYYDRDNCNLYVSGDQPDIRVWNLYTEQCVSTILSETEGCTTCIDTFSPTSNTVVAAYQDGLIKLFDLRASNEYVAKTQVRECENWIIKLKVLPNKSQFVTASVSGEIAYFDMRNVNCIKSFQAYNKHVMTACDIHRIYPIIATGSKNGVLNLFNYNTQEIISTYSSHSGLFSRRFSTINSLAFHPSNCYLSVSSVDSIVSHFAPT